MNYQGEPNGGKQACYQAKEVVLGGKIWVRIGCPYSIKLEYGQYTCHQAKFLKGTWGLVYQDRCEPTQDHRN